MQNKVSRAMAKRSFTTSAETGNKKCLQQIKLPKDKKAFCGVLCMPR